MTGDGFAFGPHFYDLRSHRLFRDQRIVAAHSRALFVLRVLLENAGRTVERERLIEEAWPGGRATDANLMVQVSRLRSILKQRPEGGRIVTERGRGYRFEGKVERRRPPETPPAAAPRFGEPSRSESLPSLDPVARRALLDGVLAYHECTPQSVARAVECFDRCLQIEPRAHRARGARALALIQLWYFGLLSGTEVDRHAEIDLEVNRGSSPSPHLNTARGALAFALRRDLGMAEVELGLALHFDPDDAAALEYRAYLRLARAEYDSARTDLLRAIRLRPGYVFLNSSLATTYSFEGRHDEALELFETAVDLAPRFLPMHMLRILAASAAGRFELAKDSLDALDTGAGGTPLAIGLRGYVAALSGDEASARRILDQLRAQPRNATFFSALVHSALGETDECVAALRAGLRDPFPAMCYLAVDPCWERVRHGPGFGRLLEDAGLALDPVRRRPRDGG